MERKLATVLFADVVGSTGLVTGSDPEVVRARLTGFFDHAARCIRAHGGTVEKFAGDAVMAAFGVPVAHEDDAERAARAALEIVDGVAELGLEARVGLAAGEVVVDDGDSTFATGEAVNLAARLQQLAGPGDVLAADSVRRLAATVVEADAVGSLEVRGFPAPIQTWRLRAVAPAPVHAPRAEAPLVGREAELELLENTLARACRDRRAHLVTLFGEPGIGKSRLAREFVDGLERATVLHGRCLPYGEGITYWPLAEMVKAAAGIADDEPREQAFEKLAACCEDEAVADLLALASGVLEAVEQERSQADIAWAVRKWVETLADAAPLVLVFEDVHWAEEPLLDLVQHLATWVRDAPLLLLCLARPELLDVAPGWGGGRLRATALEIEPLDREESEQLLRALVTDGLCDPDREALLAKAEGNPLFLEETVRMVSDGRPSGETIPDTVQALIGARVDRLPPAEKALLRRAAVAGRVFWRGALEALSPEGADVEAALAALLAREFVVREPRTSIRGERAYRFKHGLFREVAYAGLTKQARALLHEQFAHWLAERAGDDLLEIRAYHLDQAALLAAELTGRTPDDLAAAAAHALDQAGRRALAREANRSARRLFLRAAELGPTLDRRYQAARAAWRMGDLPVVADEMERVLGEAYEAGEVRLEGRALVALADVALSRDADVPRARALLDRALGVLEQDDLEARSVALHSLSKAAQWVGDLALAEGYSSEALEIAHHTGRLEEEVRAAVELARIFSSRLDDARAGEMVERAEALAAGSTSAWVRGLATGARAHLLHARGRDAEADEWFDRAYRLYAEAGALPAAGRVLVSHAWVVRRLGDTARAERLFREAIRTLEPLQDHGSLCEAQRGLAELLLAVGRTDEAERAAERACESVGPYDVTSRATTATTLGRVQLAQGRTAEGEELLRAAVATAEGTEHAACTADALRALVEHLSATGRQDEAAALEARPAARAAG